MTCYSSATSQAENTYKRLPLDDSFREPTCKQSPPALCVHRLYLFFWLIESRNVLNSDAASRDGFTGWQGEVKLPGSRAGRMCYWNTTVNFIVFEGERVFTYMIAFGIF